MPVNPTQSLDEQWMAQAIDLAWRGQYTTTPNPNVGCVIVADNNELVGQGAHLKAGEVHAEVHALNMAGSKAKGATAYVTLEPCSHTGRTPPCVEALERAGVRRVVVAGEDPNPLVSGRGLAYLASRGIQVQCGVLEQSASELNLGFFSRMRTGRPYVRLKLASSLDGRIALSNGESQWITGASARQDVQRYRASSCAVLTGSGTVKADNPSLLVRPEQANINDYPLSPVRQPLRVVIDSTLALAKHYAVFNDGSPTVLATLDSAKSKSDGYAQDVELWDIDALDNKVSLPALLDRLGETGINNLWVECGGQLAGALFEQSLIDEFIVYFGPVLMGETGVPLLRLPEYASLDECTRLKPIQVKTFDHDVRINYSVNRL